MLFSSRNIVVSFLYATLLLSSTGDIESAVRVEARLSKAVAAVGEPFVIDVAVMARGRDIIDGISRSYRFSVDSSAVIVLRSEAPVYRTDRLWGGRVVVSLTQRYVLRCSRPGTFVGGIAAFHNAHGEATEELSNRITCYDGSPDFLTVSRSVMPVVVDQYNDRTGTSHQRVGSAFLVSRDALVTSYHVVVGGGRIRVRLPDGRSVRIKKMWAIDAANDVAVLYIEPRLSALLGLIPLDIAAIAGPERFIDGEEVVYTSGWPSGVQRTTAGLLFGDGGVIDRRHVWISSNQVRPGDSGGPLLDENGFVLGVVSSGSVISSGDDVLSEEVCFATDVRPAMLLKLAAERPRSVREVTGDRRLRQRPHVRALQLASDIEAGTLTLQQVRQRLNDLEGLLEAEPDAGLHFVSGSIHRMIGAPVQSRHSFERALAVSRDFFPADYMLGVHYLEVDDLVNAGRHFESTGAHRPYAHLAAYGMAKTRMRQLRYDDAIRYLTDVLDHDPAFAPALYDLALCYIAIEETDQALLVASLLRRESAVWYRRLVRVKDNELLRPRVLEEMPRLPVRLYY